MDFGSAKLGEDLSKSLIPSHILLDRLRMIDEDSRKSSQYQDPKYLPFYYYLSKLSKPETILNVGFDLGLPLCCFLQGCQTVKNILCFQRPKSEFYSPRIGLSNIKAIKGKSVKVNFHSGAISDAEMQNMMSEGFDLVLVTEKAGVDLIHEAMEACWTRLRLDGFMVVENLTTNPKLKGVFRSFCKARSREDVIFSTRYGTGVVQK